MTNDYKAAPFPPSYWCYSAPSHLVEQMSILNEGSFKYLCAQLDLEDWNIPSKNTEQVQLRKQRSDNNQQHLRNPAVLQIMVILC